MGAPPRPTATRDRLIAGALELVASGGQEALTLRALGDHCGLSRGAPYRHFADKDALVHAIAAAGMAQLAQRMSRAARTAKGTGTPLGKAMHAYVRWARANPDWYALTFQHKAATNGASKAPELEEAAYGLLGLVTGLVEDAQAAGQVPAGPPIKVVGILWSTLHGAVDLASSGHAKPELETDLPHQVVDSLIDLLRR
jgi:AcrR family transcriptional regulator